MLDQTSGASPANKISPPGEPVIRQVNWGGLRTLYVKEVRRFFKVQLQTVWAPAVTTLLYLVIFTVALGARAVLLGRGTAYGLAAAGEKGVDRALAIFQADLTRTMMLLGSASVAQLGRAHLERR